MPHGRMLREMNSDDEMVLNSEENEAATNFYFLLEQVYTYRLETGLENENI